jgi:CAAX prenyl protease-like protein
MSTTQPDTPATPPAPSDRRDDWAYIVPMALFLLFTWVGGQWKDLYPLTYLLKTLVVPVTLFYFWKQYTRIRWDYWWLGAIVGVIGIVQWVPMQLGLQWLFPDFFKPDDTAFNPRQQFQSAAVMWVFITVRLIGATLVVPVMEELFWRDFAWRTILAPNDFKLARVGEWGWQAFVGTSVVFAVVHGNWWLTSIVWALMVATLLVYTKSLGACIVAHGVTNLLLGLYVLYKGFLTSDPQWWFW